MYFIYIAFQLNERLSRCAERFIKELYACTADVFYSRVEVMRSVVIWSVDGATVIVFEFGAKSQFSPASRCCSCAFPLSVQEFVDCITSVILRQESSSVREELRYFFTVRT